MRSCDTNILFYAFHTSCPEHTAARSFLESASQDRNFVICELVLAELYVLLRNPRLVERPLSAPAAAASGQALRENPDWGLIDYPGRLMDRIWALAREPSFGYRQIFDARLALTMLHHGVTEFATRNISHFENYGFESLVNPIDS